MTNGPATRAILLDIEGTVAPISFVHEVLFPYARQRMDTYVRRHWNDQTVAAARKLLDPESSASTNESLATLMTILNDLMDRDVKSTGLKQLQGLIWDEGYRCGSFQSPVYDDVPPALARWTAAGKTVAIYSSGSIAAQKVFFRYTTAGDLTPFLSAHFDTTIGPKRSPSSFAAIAAALKLPVKQVVFISDVLEEVQAAAAAGMQGRIAMRPGNAPVERSEFLSLETLDGVIDGH